jgi:hypothetical protein
MESAMRFAVLFLSGFLLSACATNPASVVGSGGSESSAATAGETCSVAQCAYNVRVVLKEKNGRVFDKTFDAVPVVQESIVSVYAGTTVYFEADIDGGRLVNLKRVAAINNPTKTVATTLTQDEKSGMMVLSTQNPFGKPLRIRMGMMPLAHDGLVKTSSCPVMAHGGGFEMWPYPIFQVVLGNMRLLEQGEPMGCAD